MSEDYTAPLGLGRDRSRRPSRLWPFALGIALAATLFVVGWAVWFHDPDGGQPIASVALPALPPAPPPPPAADSPAPEPPDDPSGQIIIRDP
ncbi:hypothetical protein C3941_24255 [Kaistia algarum]|uniref:hypothetical protein n=1 Tax=Kaistia algarum TaxID=2083279 RepID=UPI000CE81FBB|nr:hypothetical protein [Kaistia algarum]MCX5514092.1 hypothetical protein [Kaistia algarum]PPE77328.1 hypothetical protein C3941_24255 [Kaistia algarum]